MISLYLSYFVQALIPHFAAVRKNWVKLSIKFGKRRHVSKETKGYIAACRDAMKAGSELMTLMNDKSPDLLDFENSLKKTGREVRLPACFAAKYQVLSISDTVQFGETADLKDVLARESFGGVVLSAEELHQVNHEGIELALAKSASSVTTHKDQSLVEPLQAIAETTYECTDSLSDDAMSDLMLLSRSLLFDAKSHERSDATPASVYRALVAQLKGIAQNADYAGILKSVVYTKEWKMIAKLQDNVLAAFEKLEGAAGFITEFATLTARYIDATAPMTTDDIVQFDKLCDKVVKSLTSAEDATKDKRRNYILALYFQPHARN